MYLLFNTTNGSVTIIYKNCSTVIYFFNSYSVKFYEFSKYFYDSLRPK